ncbi:tetratricopeptide repeat protein [Polynucleobacter sp. AP-Kolm-20A-A1]|uniref:tetratricopeptide repeat protein n=1 Tax=Polynucleobacter sp. AP-Kolm-20A-A1 TaxID=2081041 RepID=UPI001BFD54AD|nr:tetratricopeptide repeat protein [Polynucleobacter sp. AP-Kolm-20A-A1]QWE20736.1 tetratricopeptide repeat protein [Polynucleobacter sp. AP-Kolm-20A-A1]
MTENLEVAKHHFEAALTALEENNDAQAEIELRKALKCAPARPSILANLSAVLIRQSKWGDAKDICAELLVVEPNSIEGIINLGICAQNTNNLDSALDYFNQALAIDPNSSSAWVNKGNILLEKELFADARSCFETAHKLGQHLEEAHIGLANLHNELKEYSLGLAHLSEALSINPQNFQAQWNKALSLLRLGQFEEGWKLYESRWHISGMAEHARHQNIQLWLGNQSLAGKTILIHAEQGFGDAIQMSRYLPLLAKENGAKVIFEVPPSLTELMRSLGSEIAVISSNSSLEKQIQDAPEFQCPVMSLPLALRTTLDTVPNQTPYLFATSEKRLSWENRLNQASAIDKPFRVGIAWSGSGHYAGKKNHKRDVSFDEICSLINSMETYPIEFHAIQKDLEDIPSKGCPRNLFLHSHLLNNFADTAALIAELNLIISIDTAVGHLAGALGNQTLLLLPDPPDFMFMTEVKISPWYPNTQLIRQEQRGIWPLDKIQATILNSIANL